MKKLQLNITLYEYWHAGTGRSSGPLIDAAIVRTKGRLPYLPGRTLRGLLREGVLMAEESGLDMAENTTALLFGGPNQDGILRVSDARLSNEMETWAATQTDECVDALVGTIASTAIDDSTGTAQKGSLRAIEVAIPMTLHAVVHVLEQEDFVENAIVMGVGFVRGIGSGRRRGLGRVQIRVEEVGT